MNANRILITGATGMVGTAVARRAVEAGHPVRAMVRATSDCSELKPFGVEFVEADIGLPETLPAAVKDVDIVVHAAAHVGDWGPAEKYRAINVVGLEHLLNAVEREGRLARWIQISSLGVYPAGDHYGTEETSPVDLAGLDGYTRTKAEAEVLLKRHMEEYQVPAVILRPGFIYGPGDRHVVPRLIERIEAAKMKIIGDGRKVLNNTYVGNLVDAILLAVERDKAAGEVFNIRDERLVTRVEFIGTIADYLGRPRPRRIPLWLARSLVGPIEAMARARGKTEAPILTRARIKFMTLNLDFSIAKAKQTLGYQAHVDFQDGMRQALEWASRSTGRILRAASEPG
ncbi:MAG: NAD-dependent epimerase/dehydratase family protein [Rhodopirellula sp.]|nr:NAD-dependent epimerase/dehydratase family protein [Rhodopirellula sp.]